MHPDNSARYKTFCIKLISPGNVSYAKNDRPGLFCFGGFVAMSFGLRTGNADKDLTITANGFLKNVCFWKI